jgi:hypothetical protein
MAVTSWNSTPNYDEWGRDTAWSCADWARWHTLLKEHFGAEKAKYIWEYAYQKGTMGASHYDCRTFNTEFRTYVSKNKLSTYDSAGILSPILNVSGGVLDVVDSIGDTISNFAKGLGNAGKVLKIAVPVALVGAGIYFGAKAYKNLKNPNNLGKGIS